MDHVGKMYIFCLVGSRVLSIILLISPPHHREDNELVRVNLLKLHSYYAALSSSFLVPHKKGKYLFVIRYSVFYSSKPNLFQEPRGSAGPRPSGVSGGLMSAKILPPSPVLETSPGSHSGLRGLRSGPVCPRNPERRGRICPSDVQTHHGPGAQYLTRPPEVRDKSESDITRKLEI